MLRVPMSTGDLLRATSVGGAVVCQEKKEDLTYDIILCRLSLHGLLADAWMLVFSLATCCLVALSSFFNDSLSSSIFSRYLCE